MEISTVDEQSLRDLIDRLELDWNKASQFSYLQLIEQKNLPRWTRWILRLHDRIGVFTFGITSGLLTTVGVFVGVNSATSSKLSVVAAIISIAVADSASDAFGMYLSKRAERGSTPDNAYAHALGTFAGKAFLPLTFLIPLFVMDLESAVYVNLAWAFTLLAALSAEQAIVEQQPVLSCVARSIGLAALIVAASILCGQMIAYLPVAD